MSEIIRKRITDLNREGHNHEKIKQGIEENITPIFIRELEKIQEKLPEITNREKYTVLFFREFGRFYVLTNEGMFDVNSLPYRKVSIARFVHDYLRPDSKNFPDECILPQCGRIFVGKN